MVGCAPLPGDVRDQLNLPVHGAYATVEEGPGAAESLVVGHGDTVLVDCMIHGESALADCLNSEEGRRCVQQATSLEVGLQIDSVLEPTACCFDRARGLGAAGWKRLFSAGAQVLVQGWQVDCCL
jgi:hypothetical protein